MIFEIEGVIIYGVDIDMFIVMYIKDGKEYIIICDFVVGCDGFYGVSCKIIFDIVCKEYEKVFFFGWLGILLEMFFVYDELIYVNLM